MSPFSFVPIIMGLMMGSRPEFGNTIHELSKKCLFFLLNAKKRTIFGAFMSNSSILFQSSAADLLALLQKDSDGVLPLFEQFSRRYLHVKRLGVDRNTFSNWDNGGLIPFERTDTVWRKFSFVEAVWIRCIQEMRSLGLSINTIREIKNVLWSADQDAFYDLLIRSFQNSTVEHSEKKVIEMRLETEGTEWLKQAFQTLQLSPLFFVVAVSILRKITYLLVINCQKEVSLVPLVDAAHETVNEEVLILQKELFSTSCTVVNLWSIIKNVAQNENVMLSKEVLLTTLSPREQKILQYIEDKAYSEIIVQKDKEGTPSHIRLKKKEGVSEEVIKKLLPYLKKGAFEHIQFKTRDGQLIQYDETSIVKLNQ